MDAVDALPMAALSFLAKAALLLRRIFVWPADMCAAAVLFGFIFGRDRSDW